MKVKPHPSYTHGVKVSYDGVCDERFLSIGTHAQCLDFIRRHWDRYVKGKQALELIDIETGRLQSYVLR